MTVPATTSAMVRVLPPAHRASWAREQTVYDTAPAPSSPPAPAVAMHPLVQRVCERIEKGVEGLIEALEIARKLETADNLNDADRDALRAVIELGRGVLP